MVYATALACAPSGVAQKSQFFLPTVKGRMEFSLKLFDRLHRPSSRYVYRYCFRFWAYFTALSKREFTAGCCFSSHPKKLSMTGLDFFDRYSLRCSKEYPCSLQYLSCINSLSQYWTPWTAGILKSSCFPFGMASRKYLRT